MTIETLTSEEIGMVSGGNGVKLLAGCVNGALAGSSAARSPNKWQGAGAGCIVGASVARVGGGSTAQSAAGFIVGAGFGPYAGSSSNPSAANYENSFDRLDSAYRTASV